MNWRGYPVGLTGKTLLSQLTFSASYWLARITFARLSPRPKDVTRERPHKLCLCGCTADDSADLYCDGQRMSKKDLALIILIAIVASYVAGFLIVLSINAFLHP
jgi:hypothetical protein